MAYSDEILSEPSLIGYWRLEEVLSVPTDPAYDEVDSGRHLQVGSGGVSPDSTNQTGLVTGSVRARHMERYYLSVAGSLAAYWPSQGGSYAAEAWVKRDNAADTSGLFVVYSDPNSGGVAGDGPNQMVYRVMLDGSDLVTNLQFLVPGTGGDPDSGIVVTRTSVGVVPSDTDTYHIVSEWYGGGTRLRHYVNGVQADEWIESGQSLWAGTLGNPIAPDGGEISWASAYDVDAVGTAGTRHNLLGTIDELALYDAPLTASRWLAHYTAGGGIAPPTGGGRRRLFIMGG